MTGWHTGPMVGFDLETTGVDTDSDRIVTAAVVAVGKAPARWSWLVNPGIPIPAGATRIHGINDRMVQNDGQPAFEAVDQITNHLAVALSLDIPIVCANAAFDLTVLDRECRRYLLPTLEQRAEQVRPVIDVQVLDKFIDPYRKGKRTLEALCAHYGVVLDGAHDATADATAALRVAWKIAAGNNGLASQDLFDLHESQIKWRYEQQTGLAAYFRKQGKHSDAASVDTAWPFKPVEAAF